MTHQVARIQKKKKKVIKKKSRIKIFLGKFITLKSLSIFSELISNQLILILALFFSLVIDNEQYLRPKLWPNRQLPYFIYIYNHVCSLKAYKNWHFRSTDSSGWPTGTLFMIPLTLSVDPLFEKDVRVSGSLLHPRYFLICACFSTNATWPLHSAHRY